MLDLAGATVGQTKCQYGLAGRVQRATEPCARGKEGTCSPPHHAGVPEWVTDGQVAVIGHDCVEETLGAPQEVEEVELGHAIVKRDSSGSWGDQGHQHFGHSDCGKPHVDEGQVCQEEAHGGVEVGIHHDYQQDEKIPHHSEYVNHQEDSEKGDIQHWCMRKAHEDKLFQLARI